MPSVVRFVFPGAVSAGIDVFVPGAGLFRSGTLDVAASDTSAVAAVRGVVTPLGATEVGTVDNAIVPPPASGTNDPYPQYLTFAEAAFVPGRVLNNNGTVNTQKKISVKLTADGLDIDDLIIEDVT